MPPQAPPLLCLFTLQHGFFDSLSAAGMCPRRFILSKMASQSFASAGGKKFESHFLSRHVRERKYFSGCKCGICPPVAGKLCAQQTAIPLSEKPFGFSDSLIRRGHVPAAAWLNPYIYPRSSSPAGSPPALSAHPLPARGSSPHPRAAPAGC